MTEIITFLKPTYIFIAQINEGVGLVIIAIGILFNIFGSIGLIRMPDVYNRLQAATKCVTFGTFFLLFGVFVYFGVTHIESGIKALLCGIFIFLTSPVSAHAIGKASHVSGIKLWEKSVMDKYLEDREGTNPVK